mmetsp:Transcript_14907/g.15625  ORF Transcript_14907/g.15625 Transcript_14907/m.15625 type:complete len:330 (+) Transcript_14907:93-1082(+)
MFFYFLILLFFFSKIFSRRLSEQERIQYWKEHHTWPPNWQIESEGYKKLMEFREKEIMNLPGSDERWENWMQYVQSRMMPKLTSKGFDLVQTPPDIAKKLQDSISKAISNWDNLPEEHSVDVIYNRFGLLPKFVNLNGLEHEVHQALLPMHEAWVGGIKLKPTSIYGVRLYQNGSSLTMHHDKVETHVISSILHIAHEYDDENNPWPIEIEDHDGKLHAVNLKPGQQLFYESAKCLHGRMKEFRGKYYGSVFIHYRPVDYSFWNYTVEDVINAVPPHWHDGVIEERGSRWAGQSITTDSRVAFGAPPRLTGAANPRRLPSASMRRHSEL